MPRYSHPAGADDVAVSVTAFGSPARVAIIRHLRAHPGANATTIGDGTGLARTTVVDALRDLEACGIAIGTPLAPERSRGVSTTYELHREQTRRLYAELGRALGIRLPSP